MTDLRTDAMVNGALVVVGAIAVVDNALVHWILEWHRLIEGWDYTLHAEVALLVFGFVVLTIGLVRERRSRQQGPLY